MSNRFTVTEHGPSRISIPEDYPSLADQPFRIEVSLRPPEFMIVTFVMLHGGSEVIKARAVDRSAVDEFLVETELRNHPRLRRITITAPNGVSEIIEK